MARSISNLEMGVGIGLIILGVVLIVTRTTIPFVAEAIGVALVAVGAVLLWRGAIRWLAAFLQFLGVLLLLTDQFKDLGQAVDEVLSIVVGVLVGLLGVLVLIGKMRPKGKAAAEPAD